MQFGREIRHDFSGIPDVAAVTGPQQTLKTLVEQATTVIDGYSRYLGRNPAKSGSLEAYLNLPLSFWPAATSERWRHFVVSRVEPVEPISLESLLRELDTAGELGAAKLPEIVANLNRALVGFEPDILGGARRPKPSEMIVPFPLSSQSAVERTKAEFKKASLIVSLSACVALADGHASENEAAAVEGMIGTWGQLHIDLRSRLRAQYRRQVRSGISLAAVKSRFASLTPDGRMQLALSLYSLGSTGGNITAAEVKLLEQIFRALELEPKLLYSNLHRGQQQMREPGSQVSSDRSGKSGYVLDTARLAVLRRAPALLQRAVVMNVVSLMRSTGKGRDGGSGGGRVPVGIAVLVKKEPGNLLDDCGGVPPRKLRSTDEAARGHRHHVPGSAMDTDAFGT